MINFLLFLIDVVVFGMFLVMLGFSIYEHKTLESLLNFMIVVMSLRCAMLEYANIEKE